jgi:hypothetical protein
MDIKYVISADQGATWSDSKLVVGETHRNSMPGIVELDDGRNLPVTFMDFAHGGHSAVRGLPHRASDPK